MNKLYVFIILLILCSFSISCEYKKTESKKVEIPEKLKPKVPEKMFQEIISIIPAPIELDFLIKDLGIQYDTLLLASPKKLSTSSNDLHNAWKFGVCMANLYYINIYENQKDAIQYLEILYKLSKKLKISDKLDQQKIQELITKGSRFSHLESILTITTESYKNIHKHLHKQNKSDLVVMTLTANHLEGLYLACQFMGKRPNQLVNQKIIEQGLILEKLLHLLSLYENEPQEIAKVHKEIQNIFKVYQKELDIQKIKDEIRAEEEAMEKHGLINRAYQKPQVLSDKALNEIKGIITQLRNKMLR